MVHGARLASVSPEPKLRPMLATSRSCNPPVQAATAATTVNAPVDQPTTPALAKGSSEEKLKAHGLANSGVYFVVASEAEILEKFEKVRPLIARMAEPFNMFAEALRNEMLLTGAEEYYSEMKARVDAANSMLSKMPNGNRANSEEKLEYQTAQAARDGLTQERDSSLGVVEAMRAQRVSAERKAELAKDFNAKWSDFLKATNELTPLIDKTLGEYRKLQGDLSVKDALAAVRRSTKAAALLGPSKNLQKAIDTIEEAKRRTHPRLPHRRDKGGRRGAEKAPKEWVRVIAFWAKHKRRVRGEAKWCE